MSTYSREDFPGFTFRGPSQTISSSLRSSRGSRRTSRAKRVTFEKRKKSHRKSKKRKSKKRKSQYSPRTGFIKRLDKVFKRHSRIKFKNPYMRNLAELTVVLAPFITAAVGYSIYKNSQEKPKDIQ
jgi:hypothetical protein